MTMSYGASLATVAPPRTWVSRTLSVHGSRHPYTPGDFRGISARADLAYRDVHGTVRPAAPAQAGGGRPTRASAGRRAPGGVCPIAAGGGGLRRAAHRGDRDHRRAGGLDGGVDPPPGRGPASRARSGAPPRDPGVRRTGRRLSAADAGVDPPPRGGQPRLNPD